MNLQKAPLQVYANNSCYKYDLRLFASACNRKSIILKSLRTFIKSAMVFRRWHRLAALRYICKYFMYQLWIVSYWESRDDVYLVCFSQPRSTSSMRLLSNAVASYKRIIVIVILLEILVEHVYYNIGISEAGSNTKHYFRS